MRLYKEMMFEAVKIKTEEGLNMVFGIGSEGMISVGCWWKKSGECVE